MSPGPTESDHDGFEGPGDLHGRPTAGELVDAVAGFLRDELLDATHEPLRHQVRIAAHVLSVVARELALGPAQEKAHRDRLDSLGVADDAELCRAIRRGELDGSAELRAALTADTTDRLLVANPGWLRAAPESTPG